MSRFVGSVILLVVASSVSGCNRGTRESVESSEPATVECVPVVPDVDLTTVDGSRDQLQVIGGSSDHHLLGVIRGYFGPSSNDPVAHLTVFAAGARTSPLDETLAAMGAGPDPSVLADVETNLLTAHTDALGDLGIFLDQSFPEEVPWCRQDDRLRIGDEPIELSIRLVEKTCENELEQGFSLEVCSTDSTQCGYELDSPSCYEDEPQVIAVWRAGDTFWIVIERTQQIWDTPFTSRSILGVSLDSI